MNWSDYETAFREENRKKSRFSEDELIEKLKYAKRLHDNNVPIIYDIEHFSILVGVRSSEILKISNSKSKLYYKEYTILKKNGGLREIKAPLPTLDIIQRWILNKILVNLEPSIFCKSYQKNLSLKDNAKFHKRQKIVLKMDVSNFFDEVLWEHVFSIFLNLGYSYKVSKIIASMVTYSNNGKKRKGIPQGACTSPMLSNIILKSFDEKIGTICIKRKIRYTRYADDLTFSGDFNYSSIQRIVKNSLYVYGFKINEKKTQVLKENNRQIVTGIVVNDKMQVSRKYRHNLRLEIYFLLNKTNQHFNMKKIVSFDDKMEYLKSVLGKINFILQVNKSDKEFGEYKKRVYELITVLSAK